MVHAELEGYPPEGKSRGRRREDERGSRGEESGTGWEVVVGVRVVRRRRVRVVSMLLGDDENMVGVLGGEVVGWLVGRRDCGSTSSRVCVCGVMVVGCDDPVLYIPSR